MQKQRILIMHNKNVFEYRQIYTDITTLNNFSIFLNNDKTNKVNNKY